MPPLQETHDASRRILAAAATAGGEAIRDAVREALEGQVDSLAGARQNATARSTATAKAIGDALAGAVVRSRAAAREASDEAMRREFSAAGGDASDLPARLGGNAEDEARGAAVGATFAEAWLAEFTSAMTPGADPREVARRALEAVEAERVPRIAVTEAAHAFAAEREALMAEHARSCERADLPAPTKLWVCAHGGDCAACFAMCGTTRPFGEPWTVGERSDKEVLVPGQVHPGCLCSVHVMHVPPPTTVAVKSSPVGWPADLSAASRDRLK